MARLTPAMRKALQWFADHGPVGWIPMDGPTRVTRKRLEAAGLIEVTGREPGLFGVTKFQASDAGRAALRDAS